VREIQDAAKQADGVFLATDPDREGEAIAWHLVEAARLRGRPLQRVVFHEITQDAVREAFGHPRDIDMKLVDAQQARRVLDRLVGYKLSPFLWKKVRKGLSAGRVQSVAVRLVVEREREIRNFTPTEYWTIEAQLEKEGSRPDFRAKLTGYVSSKQKIEISSEDDARHHETSLRNAAYSVSNLDNRQQVKRPAAPFITSTLQQEASRRLGFPAKRAMAIAQQLYEGVPLGPEGEVGLITYMRTDSTNIASSALAEARDYIGGKYGKEFLPESPRQYTKKVKGAQEAHEAIRPTSVMRDPESIAQYLTSEQSRLYTLVWQRFVASQMADARFDVTSVDISARPAGSDNAYSLRATNTQLRFPGFRQVYVEGRDEDEEEEDVGTNPLPPLTSGDPLRLLRLNPEQHFTEPPPRYTEASLVRALEEKGIGRPSTYAPTMSVIQEREYVKRDKRFLYPTELGETVNDLLVEYFPSFMDVNFTAGMEEDLDEVADGEKGWQPVVREFYEPLEAALQTARVAAPKQVEETDQVCPESGHPLVIRWGRRGKFLACAGFPDCKYTAPLEGENGEQLPTVDEPCPDCGQPLAARTGRRGPFIGCTGYPKCRYTRPLEAESGTRQPPPQATDEKCPECEAPMVVRSGRFGQFLACSRYPECKGSKPVPTGAKCPEDGGDLVEKRVRRATFYGCSNYPACKFTVRDRPLPEPCPDCGALITQARDGTAACASCPWKGEAPAESPQPVTVA
jgi:DNA topoisomerase-1